MKQKIFTAILLLASMSASAADRDYSRWMGDLPGDMYVCSMSLPGSHDSCTYTAVLTASWSKTQILDLDEQFNLGVRCFDLRPCADDEDDELEIYHGAVDLDITYKEAVQKILDLCKESGEFAIICTNHEGSLSDYPWGKAKISKAQSDFKKAYPDNVADFKPDLTLDEVRGKILFINRDDFDGAYGAESVAVYINDWKNHNYGKPGYLTLGRMSDNRSDAVCKLYSQDLSSVTWESDVLKEKCAIFNECYTNYFLDPDYFTWCINNASAWVGVSKMTMDYYQNAMITNKYILESVLPGTNCREEGKWRGLGIVFMDYAGSRYFEEDVYGDQLLIGLIENNFYR